MIDQLLLDANVLIRVLTADKRMSARAIRAINRPGSTLLVSVVSVWEVIIKYQVGKLRLWESLDPILDEILYRSPWAILQVTPEHLTTLASLPTLHSDPFDRMLIAQALHENLTIITADERIREYDVSTLW